MIQVMKTSKYIKLNLLISLINLILLIIKMQKEPNKLKQSKFERKRIRIRTKRQITFLKNSNNKELFSIPSLLQENNEHEKFYRNMIISLLQSLLRNPYIDKYREEFYFLKGSGSKIVKGFSLLIDHLYSKEDNNDNEETITNIIKPLLNDIYYNIVKEENNDMTEKLKSLFSIIISNFLTKRRRKPISLLTTKLNNFLKFKIRKRNFLDKLFSGLKAEIFSCKSCGMSEVYLENFTLTELIPNYYNKTQHIPIKTQLEMLNKEETLEDFYCSTCDIQVFFKVIQSKTILAYPKIFCFLVNDYAIPPDIENSFLIKDFLTNTRVFKLYSCLKQSNGIIQSQVKYDDNSVIEFREDEPLLIYKSEFFSLNKENQYKMLFYYDIRISINIDKRN